MSNSVTTINKLDLLHRTIELRRRELSYACMYVMYCILFNSYSTGLYHSLSCCDVLSTYWEYEISCFGVTVQDYWEKFVSLGDQTGPDMTISSEASGKKKLKKQWEMFASSINRHAHVLHTSLFIASKLFSLALGLRNAPSPALSDVACTTIKRPRKQFTHHNQFGLFR